MNISSPSIKKFKQIALKVNHFIACSTTVNVALVLKSFIGIPSFLLDALKIHKIYSGPIEYLPITIDKHQSSGSWEHEYFWQDLLAASFIRDLDHPLHCDVGSRLDGFVSAISLFKSVHVADIRPLNANIPNVKFFQCDISQAKNLSGDKIIQKKYNSVSCLHALEHIGLGRYGDPILKNGWQIGLSNLSNLLLPGGKLLVSVPCGRSRLLFNANYIIDPRDFFKQATDLKLTLHRLYRIQSDGYEDITASFSLDELSTSDYNLLMFIFNKLE